MNRWHNCFYRTCDVITLFLNDLKINITSYNINKFAYKWEYKFGYVVEMHLKKDVEDFRKGYIVVVGSTTINKKLYS